MSWLRRAFKKPTACRDETEVKSESTPAGLLGALEDKDGRLEHLLRMSFSTSPPQKLGDCSRTQYLHCTLGLGPGDHSLSQPLG